MIAMNGLDHRFNPGTVGEVHALRGLDLEVPAGQFVTIIGTNGSGKSTLLGALAGDFRPDRGSIRLDGRDVTPEPAYSRAGILARVFQNPFLGTAPEMTVAENLHMAFLRRQSRGLRLGLNHARREAYRGEVQALEMGLENRMDQPIGTLSGGQRQALTLLMAVIAKPKILLLDEHTAALDPKSAAQVLKLTQRFIERDNLTTLMITHGMGQALELGHRTVMMHQGLVIEDIPEAEKRRLTVEDLLDRFAELRRGELLTEEMLLRLRRAYV